jgi:hypothetical protein
VAEGLTGDGYSVSAADVDVSSRAESQQLATTPADQLLSLAIAAESAFHDSGTAYAFAKRANLLRVQAASATWGARGARRRERAMMRAVVEVSNAKRFGTAADIAAAVEFLVGPASSFVSGADLLVDGGVTAVGALAGTAGR